MSKPLIPLPTIADKVLLVVFDERQQQRLTNSLNQQLFPIWRELIEFVQLDFYGTSSGTSRDVFKSLKFRLLDTLRISGAEQVWYPAKSLSCALPIFTNVHLSNVKEFRPYSTDSAVVSRVLSHLANWQYEAIDCAFANSVSRRTNSLRNWMEQWNLLGLGALGAAVAKSIQIVASRVLIERLCPEAHAHRQHTSLIPCYVILLEDEYDSNTLLREHFFTFVSDALGVRCYLLLAQLVSNELGVEELTLTEYGASLPDKERIHGPIDWQRVDRLILIDEINVTGHKAYSKDEPKSQLKLMESLANLKQKPFVLRFAYSTQLALNYKQNTKKWDAAFASRWFNGIEVIDGADVLRNVSSDSPMAFTYAPKADWPEGQRVGAYLSQSHPLGTGNMATTLLFCNVVPANTYPPLVKILSNSSGNGTSPQKWTPLIVDVKRSWR